MTHIFTVIVLLNLQRKNKKIITEIQSRSIEFILIIFKNNTPLKT